MTEPPPGPVQDEAGDRRHEHRCKSRGDEHAGPPDGSRPGLDEQDPRVVEERDDPRSLIEEARSDAEPDAIRNGATDEPAAEQPERDSVGQPMFAFGCSCFARVNRLAQWSGGAAPPGRPAIRMIFAHACILSDARSCTVVRLAATVDWCVSTPTISTDSTTSCS